MVSVSLITLNNVLIELHTMQLSINANARIMVNILLIMSVNLVELTLAGMD